MRSTSQIDEEERRGSCAGPSHSCHRAGISPHGEPPRIEINLRPALEQFTVDYW